MEAGPDRRRGREHASAAGTAGTLMGTSRVSCEGYALWTHHYCGTNK